MVDEEFLCICDSDEVREICLARRESGLCPQLPVIEQLKRKLLWLEEASGMKAEDYCPERGGENNEEISC